MTSLEGSRKKYSFRVTLRDDLLPSIESEPSDGLFFIFSAFEIIAYEFPNEDAYYYNPARPLTEDRFIVAPEKILGEDSTKEFFDMFNEVNVPADYHDLLKNKIESITCNVACTRFLIFVEIKAMDVQQITDCSYIQSDAIRVRIHREARDVLPVGKSFIEELERVKVEEIGSDNDRMCAICLDDFSDHEEVIRTPCLHTYHGICIFPWLEKSNLCPMCRFEMPVDESLV